jgi:uncharacterized protein (DUF2062 family)/SAM-dependent methyltransferase
MSAEAAPAQPPRKGVVRWLKRAWRQLKREQLTPARFGVAVGMGLFWGLSPFWGLQTVCALTLAHILRLNKLAVAAGVTISAPPFLPFEVLASIQIGQRLLYGTWAPVTMEQVRATPAKELVQHYLYSFGLGAIILGLLVAVPAGIFAAWQMKRVQRNPRPTLDDASLEAFDDALPALPRRYRYYAAWKLRLDPIYPIVVPKLAGRREVVDLGAGMGMLAFFLRAASPQTKVRCVEWDAEKAQVARRLLTTQAEVLTADARTAELGTPDAIVLMDVLHYVPAAEQRAWIDRCVKALEPGGMLLLRELDPEVGDTSTRIEERAVKGGWNKGAGVYPWPLSQVKAHLEGLGLRVTREQVGKGLFRANALLVAQKPLLSSPHQP